MDGHDKSFKRCKTAWKSFGEKMARGGKKFEERSEIAMAFRLAMSLYQNVANFNSCVYQ